MCCCCKLDELLEVLRGSFFEMELGGVFVGDEDNCDERVSVLLAIVLVRLGFESGWALVFD